ncbi:MAG: phosphate regulon sensor histidine kinase PhoR [Giesbergeria sp.]
MWIRSLIFLAAQLLGAGVGFAAHGAWGALWGSAATVWLWFLVDLVRAERVLRWLRNAPPGPMPARAGVLGEVVERVQRLLRAREQTLQESEQHLRGMLDALQASPNGVLLLDGKGCIAWCNHNAAQHLSIDAQRDAGQFIGNLLRDPDFAAWLAGGDWSRELVITTRANSDGHAARLSIQLCAYGEGQKLMLTRDVTALEQAEAMRRDFVANVSHEIRTPLTVLAGFVETLQTLNLDAQEESRYLALMAQQAQRMQRVVEGLLSLSRLEASPPPGSGQWVSVAMLLDRCEQEARALAETLAPGQALHFPKFAHAEDAGEIAGVSAELHSALSNLVGNAVRYTPASGSVDVLWTWQADGSAIFSVRDTGPGIEAEHLPRITERFYRVDRSRSRDTGGTGLGLAIAKHVAQRHGAQIGIESVVGKGSIFSIAFPASRLRWAAGLD